MLIKGIKGARFVGVTLIEVIEHLTRPELAEIIDAIACLMEPGGTFVISTPNYASSWPVLELLLSRLSDVSYEEQHVTKFNAFTFARKLAAIAPALSRYFERSLVTTSHLITPFLAVISLRGMLRLARLVPHRYWRIPFGNLCLGVFTRNRIEHPGRQPASRHPRHLATPEIESPEIASEDRRANRCASRMSLVRR